VLTGLSVVEAFLVAEPAGPGVDVDVGLDGGWVLARAGDHGTRIELSDGRTVDGPEETCFPVVRFLADGRLLLLDRSPASGGPNAWILRSTGLIDASFVAGWGIEDVVVLRDFIAVTYFDEGIYKGSSGQEGVAFFDLDGRRVVGYREMMGASAVGIEDCCAACRVDSETLAFCPYDRFPLVRVTPRTRRQRITELPRILHGASAISMFGDLAFFFGLGKSNDTLFAWREGEGAVEVAHLAGRARGLEGGRFLAASDHGFSILSLRTEP
jgi:hypothetical protein